MERNFYDSDNELLISRGRNKNRGRKPTVEEDKKYVMAGSFVSISRLWPEGFPQSPASISKFPPGLRDELEWYAHRRQDLGQAEEEGSDSATKVVFLQIEASSEPSD
jgi:hypothetical protein